eukprot:13285540-Heterocapsa_arctica.AAC.1
MQRRGEAQAGLGNDNGYTLTMRPIQPKGISGKGARGGHNMYRSSLSFVINADANSNIFPPKVPDRSP